MSDLRPPATGPEGLRMTVPGDELLEDRHPADEWFGDAEPPPEPVKPTKRTRTRGPRGI